MHACISSDDEQNKSSFLFLHTNWRVLKVDSEGEILQRNCRAQEVLVPEIR